MAELPKTHSASSPEWRAANIERGKRGFVDSPERAITLRPKNLSKRNYSEAGKAVQRTKLEIARAAQEAKAAELGFESSIEYLADHNRHRHHNEERDAAIAERARQGATLSEILAEFGIKKGNTVHAALARQGVEVNFSGVAAKHPKRWAQAKDLMHTAKRQAQSQRKASMLARWAELGKTWGAIELLSAEFSVKERYMRTFLRKNGEMVPDGRLVSPRRYTSQQRPRQA